MTTVVHAWRLYLRTRNVAATVIAHALRDIPNVVL